MNKLLLNEQEHTSNWLQIRQNQLTNKHHLNKWRLKKAKSTQTGFTVLVLYETQYSLTGNK